MAKYLVTWSLVNAPGGGFYQGREVTAAELGADEARIAHLVALGALEPVAEEQSAPAPADDAGGAKGKAGKAKATEGAPDAGAATGESDAGAGATGSTEPQS